MKLHFSDFVVISAIVLYLLLQFQMPIVQSILSD
jgi:hypothetical protein